MIEHPELAPAGVHELTRDAAHIAPTGQAATVLAMRAGGLHVVAVAGRAPWATSTPTRRDVALSDLMASLLASGRQVAVADLSGEALAESFVDAFGSAARALVVTPLRIADEVLGGVVVIRPEPGPWAANVLAALTDLAARSIVAIRAACRAHRRDLQAVEIERVDRALRTESHEYANHLHAIGALIAMGEADEARRFAQTVARQETAIAPGLDALDDDRLTVLLSAEHALVGRRGLRLAIDVHRTIGTMTTRTPPGRWADVTSALLESAYLDNAQDDHSRRSIALELRPDGAHGTQVTMRHHVSAPRGPAVLDTLNSGGAYASGDRRPRIVTIWHSLLDEAARAVDGEISVTSIAGRVVTAVRIPGST